jgi:hypothetical protein
MRRAQKEGPFSISKASIEEIAKVDPTDLSQIAESQLKIINAYYQNVLYQAKESFLWALVAAGCGLVFFIVSVAFLVHENSDRIANISLISGAIVEVIAGIDFYLYARTSEQLARFHVRLDITQRFLLANSLCESLEGPIKHETRAKLVQMIASGQSGLFEEPNFQSK